MPPGLGSAEAIPRQLFRLDFAHRKEEGSGSPHQPRGRRKAVDQPCPVLLVQYLHPTSRYVSPRASRGTSDRAF